MPLLPNPAPTGSDNVRGILAMVISMAAFVVSDLIVKYAGKDLPLGELLFLRGFSAAIMIAVAAAATGALKSAWKAVSPLMVLRCLGDIGANLFFFLAVVRLPFAEVSAIAQFTPLALTAGAALFLGEAVGWRRWMALLVGMLGVLIIVRPGSSAFDWAALFVLASVLSVTARDLITRHMGVRFPVLLLSLFTAGAVSIGGLALMPFETWVTPSNELLFLMLISGVGVFIGNYTMILALRTGEIAVVAPFRYTILLFAVIGGYLVFGEIPDSITFLGIAVLIGAGLYTLHRERIRMRTQIRKVS
jgi:drug/metabolite transporter (DMT)-like permease